jgi:chemotaxis protein methyltransferase CheR
MSIASLPADLSFSELSAENYRFIARVVYEQSRINLGAAKKPLVASRLVKRLRALRLPDYDSYCRLLRSSKGADEALELVNAISTNHTQFFREARHFDFLTGMIIPLAKARAGIFRVWSAACATGEEPYSLAILLSEGFGIEGGWRIQATDISTSALKVAQQGIYPTERLAHVPPEWQRRYFQRGVRDWTGQYRVRDDLRRRVEFHRLNLLQASYPFAAKFDVIFCRNVMIYFDRETQEALVQKLSQQLAAGGYLMVGHSESLSGLAHGLTPIQPALYQKK